MSELIQIAARPLPSVAMSVRVGTREDVPFMDALQKANSKALGFFPRAQMESYIDAGNVLVAEAGKVDSYELIVDRKNRSSSSLSTPNYALSTLLGYVIAKDRYLKRDELGAVFQLCVVPGKQRSFIGANLLREVFERSAYGCRLFCCWCAQDLPANRFWEAMGFVPLAYRAGSEKKSRVHIYWQKRIRAGDDSTPYWFPAKTEGGAIREDRIILPIPPGMTWRDELPILSLQRPAQENVAPTKTKKPLLLPGMKAAPKTPTHRPGAGIQFRPINAKSVSNLRTVPEGTPQVQEKPVQIEKKSAPKLRADRVKPKADPALIQKARDLRDKWMDHVGANGIESVGGKYDLQKSLPAIANRIAA